MAYAAMISVMHTLQRLKVPINRKITKSACKELDSLSSTLKGLDGRSRIGIDRSVLDDLDAKIRDAVWKLEDVLEPYVLLYNSLPTSQRHGVDEIDSFLKRVKKLGEEYTRELQNPSLEEDDDDDAAVSLIHNHLGGNKSTTVGLSDLSVKVRNELLDRTSEHKTVSLVGMAGIGKSHLATLVYHHPLILQSFKFRLWVSVGPKKREKNMVVDILAQIEGKPRDQLKEKDEDALKDLLLKRLGDRRYLIVLDDIWSTQVLDYFAELLPDYENRSRFLLTTRLQEVAQHSSTEIHQMPFLNNEESWILLWQNVFAQQSFPSQLENAGRKIAEHCEGLPLLILAVADILFGLDKTEEFWNKVAKKKTTTFTDAFEKIYEVLLSSYEYLPEHLKPCFLYMGVFPQSREISISKLINLCTVEDFLEPSQHEDLEDFGQECMDNVVSTNIAIVCKWSFNGFDRYSSVKYSKLHCAYWYLCVKEARKVKFFHVLNKLTDVSYMQSQRRLSVQNNILLGIREVYDSMAAATSSTTRSLLCTGEDHQYPVQICFDMFLLKVLDALAIRFYEFPEGVLKLLQLRYLSLTHNGELPSSISKLQLLQCLILRRHHNIKLLPRDSTSCLPEEIWDMKELRHLRIMGSNLPDPSKGAKLRKLLTLNVSAHSCTENVFRSIHRLKKLSIQIELHPDPGVQILRCLEHIGILKNLKSLKCVVVNPRMRSQVVAPPEHLSNLPRGLIKLSLKGLGYSWKYMSVIASLPDLKVLKLRCSAFQGPKWETKIGEFSSLNALLLEDLDLVNWTTENCGYDECFPVLCHLIVRHCYKLKKIPTHIEGVFTLEVEDCSPSVVASAQQIKDNTECFDCQVVINSSWNLR